MLSGSQPSLKRRLYAGHISSADLLSICSFTESGNANAWNGTILLGLNPTIASNVSSLTVNGDINANRARARQGGVGDLGRHRRESRPRREGTSGPEGTHEPLAVAGV